MKEYNEFAFHWPDDKKHVSILHRKVIGRRAVCLWEYLI